jgi:hypothetical protein
MVAFLVTGEIPGCLSGADDIGFTGSGVMKRSKEKKEEKKARGRKPKLHLPWLGSLERAE